MDNALAGLCYDAVVSPQHARHLRTISLIVIFDIVVVLALEFAVIFGAGRDGVADEFEAARFERVRFLKLRTVVEFKTVKLRRTHVALSRTHKEQLVGSRFEVLSKNRLASLRLDLLERAAIDADAPLVVRVAHLRLDARAREIRLDINSPLRTLVFLRIALIPAAEILQIRVIWCNHRRSRCVLGHTSTECAHAQKRRRKQDAFLHYDLFL